MQDPFKELMFRSFKDAMDIAADYNEWAAEAFDEPMPIQPNAVPQMALLLYRSRLQGQFGNGSVEFPDLDERMYD